MYAIKSKKTGKTYYRALDNGMYDWVMFREEEPMIFFSSEGAQNVINHCLDFEDCEIVSLDTVPYADVIGYDIK